ncbi:L-rhamnose mutarotase [Fulvivirgaceae bacterium BMA12]|uniref:L-rhamnose mutarotase n=1 Tax=Agaribacillus aureus TaxID=3051825 RepID=A0ABT8LKP0_9BACT|nr:L-rhamnose mutarotase [Fulvivirgaceae bacterium BMA12]
MACDLKDNPALIEEYRHYHSKGNAWEEVTRSIQDAGILDMQIFNVKNRLFMIMEVDEHFDPERKKQMDLDNPKVQEWEKLMWKFQQALPGSLPGQKWVEMDKIFQLGE